MRGQDKNKVLFLLIIIVSFCIQFTIFSPTVSQAQPETFASCMVECHEFSLVNNQSSTTVDGTKEEAFLSFTSMMSKDISGGLYNYYTVQQDPTPYVYYETPTLVTELSQPSSKENTKTNLSLQIDSGNEAETIISGANTKLKALIEKNLQLHGFTVKQNADSVTETSTDSNVELRMTKSQSEAFVQGGSMESIKDGYSFETETYYTYVQALQDALNEYHTQKNVWLWERSPITENPDETIEFLFDHQVDHIYLHYKPALEESVYAYFIKQATANNMKVHALMGSPKWGLEAYTKHAVKRVDMVKGYNANVEKDEQFVGIHFDVEPYTLDQWDKDRANVLTQWWSSAERYITHAKDAGFIVGSALPFWTDNKKVTDVKENFFKDMVDIQDYVSIMAYRDTALGSNSITSLANSEVLYANSPKVEVGVELNPYEIDYVSFANHSNAEIQKQVSLVRRYFMEDQAEGFKGITMQSYSAWKKKEEE
ncbi:hypothetical protein GLW08_06775 [Pontibacillus yanchengensis]|uniref:Uncharacterized protein n=2 Tax=Pontibacillus yanchengensis TaxID=462910 RepID=A0A6I5A2X7_9BACI|nr:hypothetical protein [Pontibacillus yanchengensis]MYL32459.1 hypothetical protein [Pontibacillus yanchengensis]MYL53040.1 hypothetical protein [Pontibacillus yanchengensis]